MVDAHQNPETHVYTKWTLTVKMVLFLPLFMARRTTPSLESTSGLRQAGPETSATLGSRTALLNYG